MAYRWHPKYSETDPDSPRAWGTCDRCGFIWNLHRLQWQYDYRGSQQLQNLRILVCPKCYDTPQPQLSPVILSPDPPPIFNARPEPYALDEDNILVTQGGDTITTQDGTPFTTSIPNPATPANETHLTTNIPLSDPPPPEEE